MSATETRIASSLVQEGSQHPLHVEGGAELAWKLVADLHLLHLEVTAQIERLRSHHCRRCGEPATLNLGDFT